MKTVWQWLLVVSVGSLMMASASAEVHSKQVRYRHAGAELEGYLAWDDRFHGKRPGVLVVHEWWGLNDYARSRVRQLAEQGYVAFALDMYGSGKVTSHPDQASTWMKEIQQNTAQWVSRADAGLTVLRQQEQVDGERLAAIGYCFGGATVMEMAYAGLDVDFVASFHGSLPVADDRQQQAIRARILVAHGNADPFVPTTQVQAFRDALEKSGADWTMMEFGGVKHSFTNPSAADYGLDALAYDAEADHQSWQMLLWLLEDTFK
ncbi:MAG TPA: dienelactone hydrolase family protein, partial [Gammaproteobacteria bacterium]|nr:dienelactone hydrolase family protein [Gammaproteobacteria bacterium]